MAAGEEDLEVAVEEDLEVVDAVVEEASEEEEVVVDVDSEVGIDLFYLSCVYCCIGA